jgi:hypothetical protein
VFARVKLPPSLICFVIWFPSCSLVEMCITRVHAPFEGHTVDEVALPSFGLFS